MLRENLSDMGLDRKFHCVKMSIPLQKLGLVLCKNVSVVELAVGGWGPFAEECFHMTVSRTDECIR